MDQSASANSTLLGKSPPTPVKIPPEVTDVRKAVGNRRRTTSNSRHRYAANRKVAIVALVKNTEVVLCLSADVIPLTKTTIVCQKFFTSAVVRLESSSSTEGRV